MPSFPVYSASYYSVHVCTRAFGPRYGIIEFAISGSRYIFYRDLYILIILNNLLDKYYPHDPISFLRNANPLQIIECEHDSLTRVVIYQLHHLHVLNIK